ncbi:MAG: bifunctional ornithine acetyltransferase/N-acetylglutamate synthase [Rhizomicrobium sp.]
MHQRHAAAVRDRQGRRPSHDRESERQAAERIPPRAGQGAAQPRAPGGARRRGAQKLIRIDVTGAESDESARRIALSIANSPLVKTAIAGEDANWGRIVMAVGKAGEPADRDRLKISFGAQVVAEAGERAAKYNEAAATKAVKGREVEIAVDIGLGKGQARVWTCDLTHGYIDINGSYRS